MAQNQTQTAANSNEQGAGSGTSRTPAYNLAGMVSSLEIKQDQTEERKPYAKFVFDFTAGGRKQRRVTMAFGKAYDAIKDSLKPGPMRLFAKFDGGTLAVIGLGHEPKAEAQKKAA